MARRRVVDTHPQRDAIEAMIISGQPDRAVGRTFGVHHEAIGRHRRGPMHVRLASTAAAHLAALDDAATLPDAHISPAQPVAPRRALQLDDERRAPITNHTAHQSGIMADVPPLPSQTALADSGFDHAPPLPAGAAALDHLSTRALTILQEADAAGDKRTALAAIRETRAVLETIARLGLSDGTVATPLAETAEWATVRTAIMGALADFPEARLAVAAALAGEGVLQ